MKPAPFLWLLILLLGCSTQRPAAMRLASTTAYDLLTVTAVLTNGQLQGWYRWPTSEGPNAVWITEWSTNLVDWYQSSNETVHSPDGWRMTEIERDTVFLRVRRLR